MSLLTSALPAQNGDSTPVTLKMFLETSTGSPSLIKPEIQTFLKDGRDIALRCPRP